MANKFQLNEVFGVSNRQLETYVFRNQIDDLFIKSLSLQKHIIIYGGSKQGKSSLIKTHLVDEECIIVQCSPNSTTLDIYKSILRQIGATYIDSASSNYISGSELGSNVKFEIKVPFIKVESDLDSKNNDSKGETILVKSFDYNISIPQDFCELLKQFNCNKKIVIENFHYLTNDVQRKFAFDLRIFQDLGFVFIILGIWREKNHLLQFNGDLVDRIIEIPVEPWSKQDFYKILQKGQQCLNIEISTSTQDLLVSDSNLSVGVLQELCYEMCLIANVRKTLSQSIKINDNHYFTALENKLQHYSSRHTRTLEAFIEPTDSTNGNELFLHYYLIMLLSKVEFFEIEKGLSRSFIHSEIEKIHYKKSEITSSEISTFLHTIVSHQIVKNINPPIFDYDLASKTLRIIDSTLYFYLKYFQRQKLFDELTVPIGIDKTCP